MSDYTYVIIGGGMTADAAVRGIRELDADGTIAVVSAEPDPPYSRPPLSKGLWKGERLESIWRQTGGTGVDLHLSRQAIALDLKAKRVTDDRSGTYDYQKLLFATGGSPRRFPFGGDGVLYYRTLTDFRRLRALVERQGSFAVIGGGFIGSEMAAALTMQGRPVTMFFPEEGIGARVFPTDLSRFLVDYYREKGVDVRPGSKVTNIGDGSRAFVHTESGLQLVVDGVVAGLGIIPNTELAASAGIKVSDGIVVDRHLRTSVPDVFAAGDVAWLNTRTIGGRGRVEHEDNALTMGHAAGRAMTGDMTPYAHVPFFYSDLFELGYEAVGELDPRSTVVADWKEPFGEGVIYYLTRGRVRGVLLWNTWGQVDAARALLSEKGTFTAAKLRGRLPA
jgi:3-phenylpropionate/trans-cinnamate dioxygenase ferredoxin reductase subunit